MPLMGFQPIMIFTMQAISLLYQFWIHTELLRRMGVLGLVLNTPSHHRVYHATNPQYIDRNHAGILIIWDRWFGSFEPEQEPCVYGLTTNIDSYNPLRIAFHEWISMWEELQRSHSLRGKVIAVFGNPGTKQIRDERTEPAIAAQV
jgi:sterol desaturase/sphingolipid hydroxylase (fatty acid hydroxylase superfamily)